MLLFFIKWVFVCLLNRVGEVLEAVCGDPNGCEQ